MAVTLSIGVPAFNQGKFLRATLESLLAQDEAFDEIVVSDNHSTDETAEVLRAFLLEHPGSLRVIAPERHLPANEHWNFLVGHLRSEWVSLLSSDDLALPNFAASVRKTTALSAKASFIRGGWRDIDETGRTLSDHFLMSVATITRSAEALFEQRFGPKTSFASFAVRRDVWARVGGFPAELTILGDWALALLAASVGDTVYTGDLIAAYRVRSGDGARTRHAVQMHESFLMYRDVLPQAAERAGLGCPGWIADASRTRFREVVSRTSREFTPAEREPLIEAFRPWAASLGEAALLQRFEGGAVLRNFNPARWVKQQVRRTGLGKLLARLAGHGR